MILTKQKFNIMKKVILLSSIAFMFCILTASAQKSGARGSSYQTALGVKFYPGAVTLKHFIKSDVALEGIAYFFNRGLRVTGLYEFHGDINGAPGLKWYVGPGAHVGFYNDHYYRDRDYNYKGTSYVGVGIDGVLGLDYKFNGAPINLSLDWQPSFEFGNNYKNGFSGDWGGFAIRYTF
jgi:hypothetical protein